MIQRIYFLLSIPLVVFYLAVLYLVLHPDVSDAYKKYYIEQTTTISPTELKYLQPYDPGALVDASRYRQWQAFSKESVLLFEGWAFAEADFRWSNGREVSLLFSTSESSEFKGWIELKAMYLERQRVEVFLNGHSLGEYVGEGDEDIRKIPFDPRLLKKEELNTIAFRLPDARSPRREERRKLAIALKTIRIL